MAKPRVSLVPDARFHPSFLTTDPAPGRKPRCGSLPSRRQNDWL